MTQSHGQVIALAVVFSALELSLVGLRLRARRLKGHKLGADDYFIIAASILFVLFISVPTILQAVHDHLGDHVRWKDGMPVMPSYLFVVCERIIEACHTIPISCAKLSILLFYRRIFQGNIFRVINWSTIVLASMWGVSFFFSLLFMCTPVKTYVADGSAAPGVNCVNAEQLYDSLAISDFVIDFIILGIPMPFVWELQMPLTSKLLISSILLLGLLAIAASVTRLVVFVQAAHLLKEQALDWTYYSAPTTIWTNIEGSLAIVAACLPTLRPIFRGWSSESIVDSVRSVITLRSVRSKVSLSSARSGGSRKEKGAPEVRETSVHKDSDSSGAAPRMISFELLGHPGRNEATASRSEHDVPVPELPKDAIVVQQGWESSHC